MDLICGDSGLVEVLPHQNSSFPDVSLCFQQTVLIWVPTGYIFLGFLPYLYSLRKRVKFYIVRTWLNVLKMVCGIALSCGLVSELALRVWDHALGISIWAHQLLAPGLLFLAVTVSVLLSEFERKKSVRTSMFQAGFWILCTVSSIIRFRSAIIRHWFQSLPGDFTVLCICCFLSISSMVLSFIVDKSPVFYKGRKLKGNPCPSSGASVPSRLFFCWPFSAIWKGFSQPLELADMWDLRRTFHAEYLATKLSKQWEKQLLKAKRKNVEVLKLPTPDHEIPLKEKDETLNGTATPAKDDDDPVKKVHEPSLLKAIMETFWQHYLGATVLTMMNTAVRLGSPQVLRKLIQFAEDPSIPLPHGVAYAVLLFVVSLLQCLFFTHAVVVSYLLGTKIRVGMAAMVYKKSLGLTYESSKISTKGEIISLMSTDCTRYVDVITFINTLWKLPVQLTVTIVLLYQLLGPSVFVGLICLVAVVPLNIFVGKAIKKLQVRRMKLKDSRIKETNEILNSIKIIKLYAWEPSFEQKVKAFRKEELKLLRYQMLLETVLQVANFIAPFIVAVCSFGTYVMLSEDNILTAERAFVSLAYFELLQQPLAEASNQVTQLVQTTVAHKRLYTFLMREELDPDDVLRTGLNDYSVVVRHGEFSWIKTEPPILQDIELLVTKGTTTAIVGQIGAGKSSLLSALLGEMCINKGTVNVKGSVAYVAQQSWIQQATVRDNILFNKEYDKEKYKKVVADCELLPDIEILPGGDLTEIGEKGINLSGGQKLRVSLARAVYQDADIYLLDDPLSSVDAHVGRNIFDNVLGPDGILKNKTLLLVTQSLWFLPQVDQIIVLKNGRVNETGTYEELMAQRSDFFQLVSVYHSQQTTSAANTSAPAAKKKFFRKKKRDVFNPKWSTSSEESYFEDEIVTYSLPEGLDQQPTETNSPLFTSVPSSSSNRPNNDLFKRAISVDTAHNMHRTRQKKSWKFIKNKLNRGLSTLESKLTSAQELSSTFLIQTDEQQEASLVLMDEANAENDEGDTDQENISNSRQLDDRSKDNDHRSKENKKLGLLINAEELKKGRVKMSVYTTYLRAIGLFPGLSVLALCLLFRSIDITGGIWLAKWSDDMTHNSISDPLHLFNQSSSTNCSSIDCLTSNDKGVFQFSDLFSATSVNNSNITIQATQPQEYSNSYYIAGYAIIGIAQAIAMGLWDISSHLAGLHTSGRHHNKLLSSILAAKNNFFDKTPTGRILNRFSGDIHSMDVILPHVFRNLLKMFVGVIGSLVVVALVTPWSLLAWIVLGVLYSLVQVVYIPSHRQVRRMLSAMHSPIYSMFGESLSGVATIRAYCQQDIFIKTFHKTVDNWFKCFFVLNHINRWLAIIIEVIGSTSVFIAAILVVVTRDTLTAGFMALAITYARQITHSLNWMVRLSANCESEIVSVERIKEYIDLESEGPRMIEGKRPDSDWPSRGNVEIVGYSTRYREGLDLALNNISCHIFPGEKIGVVGRTGAGKSSLTLALFRMINACEGAIIIDGVNISDIGLHDLRNKLTIIPQEPALFSGTLRFNLDPFDAHTDDDIWSALHLAHLAEKVNTLPGLLSFECTEGGDNLSVGQRQLLCLARALLKKSRILVLDEATASCDLKTDDLIQKTIRREFVNCTVITIAHRLHTVVDYDRILVLDNGRLKEFDTPQLLMDDPTSMFHSLAKNAGLIPSSFQRH